MSILNALKTSALSAGFVTLLFAGSAEAASLFDGTIELSTGTPNEVLDVDLIDGFTETTGNTSPDITFDAMAGDTLTFDFDFSSGESALAGSLFRDGGFYTLNGEAFLLADMTDMGSVSFEIDTDGEFTLGFGAFNATSLTIPPVAIPGFDIGVFDNAVSTLNIENVTITDAQAVPEPASMLGLMAVAALGGSSVLKRKQS